VNSAGFLDFVTGWLADRIGGMDENPYRSPQEVGYDPPRLPRRQDSFSLQRVALLTSGVIGAALLLALCHAVFVKIFFAR